MGMVCVSRFILPASNIKFQTTNLKSFMILSDSRILEEIEKGTIKVEPYNRDCLGSNSYDVHLGKTLATYREHILDAKKHKRLRFRKTALFYIRIFFTWG